MYIINFMENTCDSAEKKKTHLLLSRNLCQVGSFTLLSFSKETMIHPYMSWVKEIGVFKFCCVQQKTDRSGLRSTKMLQEEVWKTLCLTSLFDSGDMFLKNFSTDFYNKNVAQQHSNETYEPLQTRITWTTTSESRKTQEYF